VTLMFRAPGRPTCSCLLQEDSSSLIVRLAFKLCFVITLYVICFLSCLVVRPSQDVTHATVKLITFFVKGKATR